MATPAEPTPFPVAPLETPVRLFLAIANRVDTPIDTPFPARRSAAALQSKLGGWMVMRRGPACAVSHVEVPVDGGRITVRLYRPPVPGRLPLHVFLHGGGWCVGTVDERDPRCRAVAGGAGCLVASVDYRLAPENAWPVPVEDCYAALTWLVEHATDLDVDADCVSVGGESAGANLAAVLAILARDRSGPTLAFQWLDVPSVDLTMSQPSVSRFGTGYLLTRVEMDRYVEAYLDGRIDAGSPTVSPLFADDLSGLPPALIMTAGYDPLQDDGRAYAERLRAAGVSVDHRHLAGHIHMSFALTRLSASARGYESSAIEALRRAHTDQVRNLSPARRAI